MKNDFQRLQFKTIRQKLYILLIVILGAMGCSESNNPYIDNINQCMNISGFYSMTSNWVVEDKFWFGPLGPGKLEMHSSAHLKNYLPIYKGATQYANYVKVDQSSTELTISAFKNKTELISKTFLLGESGWSCDESYVIYTRKSGDQPYMIKFLKSEDNALLAMKQNLIQFYRMEVVLPGAKFYKFQ